MKSKQLLMIMIAGGCGLVSVLGVNHLLKNRDQSSQVERAKVLVALTDIDPGVRLDKSNVYFREVPVDSIPEGAIVNEEQYAERALKVRAFKGQSIHTGQLAEKGALGASVQVPEGMRMVTVAVDPTMTHSGLMKPGDYVDVNVTFKVNKPRIGSVTRSKTVLEMIQVCAIDNVRKGTERADGSELNAKHVSFVVWPNQAAMIKLAESKGKLNLLLRSSQDRASSEHPFGADLTEVDVERIQTAMDDNVGDDLRTTPIPTTPIAATPTPVAPVPVESMPQMVQAPVVPPPVKTWKVEIFQGEDLKVQEFELNEEGGGSREIKPSVNGASRPNVSLRSSGTEAAAAATVTATQPQSGSWTKTIGSLFGMQLPGQNGNTTSDTTRTAGAGQKATAPEPLTIPSNEPESTPFESGLEPQEP